MSENKGNPKDSALPSLKISSSDIVGSKLSKYTLYIIESDELEFKISRRYNDFKWLRRLLLICYPGLFVPPLPPPIVWGRFQHSFIEKRRHELETFLCRIRAIEIFTKSDIYQCFMHCDDKEYLNRKTEIDTNTSIINPGTALLSLQDIYPNLKEYIPDTETENFNKLQKRLKSIHEQMKALNIGGSKIYHYFKNISADLALYLNGLNTLYSKEMKSDLFTDNDLPKYTLCLDRICKYQENIKQMFDQVFVSNICTQHKDIIAFLEIFTQYQRNNKFHDRLCKSVERWEELQHKHTELTANQEKQKEADCNSKQDVFELMAITRKVVLTESITDLAMYKVKRWKQNINQFYTLQCGLHQLTKQANIEDINSNKDTVYDAEKVQMIMDENKTLRLQNKQLKKQIRILNKEVDDLRNDNIAKSIEIRGNTEHDESPSHQYDVFPCLNDTMKEYEGIKKVYLSKTPKCIMKDIKKNYMNHGDRFVMKLVHEMMFDILFASFNKMKECEFDFYMRASKLFYIQNMNILRDLCRNEIRKTYLHIFNEVKHDYSIDILDIILSSHSYSLCSESEKHLISFIEECLRICWQLMLTQNGHLVIKPKTFDFETRSKEIMYNCDLYDAYFGSNLCKTLNYIVWPSIYDTVNNAPISKIYAMFSDNIPKFSAPFIRKKLKKTQHDQYDTIRIIADPEGAHAPNVASNETSSQLIKHILARQEANLYKVYVGINFGYKEVSVGYVDNHNKKKLHPILCEYPSIGLNAHNELKGFGATALDMEHHYAFDNFMISLCENKIIEIENQYNENDDTYAYDTIDVADNNGRCINIGVLFDVTLHFVWVKTLQIIRKSYCDRFNEELEAYEIEWKISVPDLIYSFCQPLLKSSGIKLDICDNLILITESQAIAIHYSMKLKVNDKFMSVLLNEYSLIIACYKKVNEFKIKELTQPKMNKNVSLNKINNEFKSFITDIFDEIQQFDRNKMNQLKLKFLKRMKTSRHRDNANIFGDVLNAMFKEIDRLLRLKHIAACKQHIIIGGELSEIAYIERQIRDKYRNNNIHFAKTSTKIVKGTALYDVVTPKYNVMTYRANKSWGISVQTDYMERKHDKNKRIFNERKKAWSVNGVFYEIIKKGQMVKANHCKVIWVQAIHESKIQIDVYSSENECQYVDECQYEGSQSFQLLSQWKNQNEIPLVFWYDVQENNKIRLNICINDLNQATSRIIDLSWTVKK